MSLFIFLFIKMQPNIRVYSLHMLSCEFDSKRRLRCDPRTQICIIPYYILSIVCMFDQHETYPMSKLFRNMENSSAIPGCLSKPSSERQTMEAGEEQTMTHQSATASAMTSLSSDNHLCQIKSPVQEKHFCLDTKTRYFIHAHPLVSVSKDFMN